MSETQTANWEVSTRGNLGQGVKMLCRLKGERKFWVACTEGGRIVVNQDNEPSNPSLSAEQWFELQYLINQWQAANATA